MAFRKEVILLGLFILFIGLPTLYGQTEEYEEIETILKKARTNILNLKSAIYKVHYRSDDERVGKPLIMEGNVFFKKMFKNDEVGIKTKIEGSRVASKEDTSSVGIYYDGQREVFLYHEETLIKVFNRPAMLTGNTLGQLVKNILISETPFGNTLERMTDVEMKETEIVDGESCYIFTFFP